ncbi:Hypothetical predicted protein [Podarcis lilfordi]|uniref:Uncharacterized protein n=1 Tax=Podarcis lilfordi TaxID=74358 RepID=A0AA35KMR5_9SAUR|nr:Hypothetical predicted protein [Podarcis lilfordi]
MLVKGEKGFGEEKGASRDLVRELEGDRDALPPGRAQLPSFWLLPAAPTAAAKGKVRSTSFFHTQGFPSRQTPPPPLLPSRSPSPTGKGIHPGRRGRREKREEQKGGGTMHPLSTSSSSSGCCSSSSSNTCCFQS